MPLPRHVFIDPIGMGGDYLYVLVAAPTGVHYQQQYGGTACRQGRVEGYLVPVYGAPGNLRALFEEDFKGGGAQGYAWSGERLVRLRAAVGAVCYWSCDGAEETPHDLVLDEERLAEADEAWIPVRTPDGRGVLTWNNSD